MNLSVSAAVAITDLVKTYGALRALDGVNLTIKHGEFFGLLGPNGAGKTTLISCIVGLARPTSGQVVVHDIDLARDPLTPKSLIGFAPQEVNVEYFFPLHQILEFQGGYYGLSRSTSRARADALLHRFGIWDKRDVQFFQLSGGMKRRFLIVRAMMGDPKILILDEPTAGVDVAQRHELWGVLRELKAAGTTILLTTHYIDEAEALCERVGIIHQGTIAELGSPRALIQKYCDRRIVVDLSEAVSHADFADLGDVVVEAVGCRLAVRPDGQLNGRIGPAVEAVVQRIMRRPNLRIVDLQVRGGDLEEVFLKVTGSSIHA